MRAHTNKLKITEVFEIRLRITHISEITKLAKHHKITLTWVTRLCLFKLIEQYNSIIGKVMLANTQEKEDLRVTKQQMKKLHRHQLCLYGKDAIRVRFLAAQLGITITQLVRIALVLYLGTLKGYICKSSLVEIGIKFVIDVMEKLNGYIKISFEPEDYWPFRPCLEGKLFFGT